MKNRTDSLTWVAVFSGCALLPCCTPKKLPMRKIATKNGFEIHTMLLDETNVYILANANRACILVDPALQSRRIAATLKDKDYAPQAILLTHNHWDHSKEICKLAGLLRVPIVTNAEQIKMGRTFLGTPISGKRVAKVEDGQAIKVAGIQMTVLFTPGHSTGSMCFLHRDTNSLFSGDTLFRESIGRTDLPGSQADIMLDSVNSVLEAIEDDTDIYPGHGEPTTKRHEVENNPFLEGW